MSRRNIILLVIALVMAGGTAFMMVAQMSAPEPVEEVRPDNLVLAAKAPIAMGSFVRTAEQLQWQEIEKDSIDPKLHILESREKISGFKGAVARRSYQPGDLIAPETMIKPGSGGFLSAVLEPGMRAVSIAVNATSGNAGFIFPGDHVDAILVHEVSQRDPASGNTAKSIFSNVFITNARVLAVDQRLDNPENKAIPAKTVTIEVTPKQAEKVQVAGELGKVSFALRSIIDPSDLISGEVQIDRSGKPNPNQDAISALQEKIAQEPVAEFSSQADVSPALGSGAGSASVNVYRGDIAESKNFTGGE